MTLIESLTSQIQAVCPADGVSIGRKNDKGTWRIDYRPEATVSQRAAADMVLATFVFVPPDKDSILDEIGTPEKVASFVATTFPAFTPKQKAVMAFLLLK